MSKKMSLNRGKSKSEVTDGWDQAPHPTSSNSLKFRLRKKFSKKFSIKIVLNRFLISYIVVALAVNPMVECYAQSNPPSSKLHHSGAGQHQQSQQQQQQQQAHLNSMSEQFRMMHLPRDANSEDSSYDNSDELEDYGEEHHLSQSEKNNQIDRSFHAKNTTDFSLNSDDLSGSLENSPSFKCPACNRREEWKKASLESIKNHILQKLAMFNRTRGAPYPSVPANIINEFCKNNECRDTKNGHKFDFKDHLGMQGDDPLAGERSASAEGDDDEVQGGREIIEDEDDDYYPVHNSIYAFPSEWFFLLQFF
jgi:hypothetical protein